MRILSVDPGTKRLGVAVCDELEITVRPLCTLLSKGRRRDAETVHRIAKELDVERIIIGFPLSLDGSRGSSANAVAPFAEEVHKASGLEVITWDERLTSVAAADALRSRDERITKDRIDEIAACIILEDYLSCRRQQAAQANQPNNVG